MSKKGKSKKRSITWGSLKTKVVLLVLAAIAVTVISLLVLVIPVVTKNLDQIESNYMSDVCNTTGQSLDQALEKNGASVLNKDYLEKLVGKISINGVASSYAYVVFADGTMAYHKTADKIGKPVENSVVKGIVADMQAGKTVKNEVVTYDFNGVNKYAAYYVTKDKSAILVVSADTDDMMRAVTTVFNTAIIIGIATFIILGLITFFMAARMTKPLLQITKEINRFATLDFTDSPVTTRISKHKDETGQIARAIGELRTQVVQIVTQIKDQSAKLYSASNELDNNATLTATTVGSVESAVNEIATGATSQASETQKATDNIIDMGNMIEHTNSEVENLNTTAMLMKTSSDEASATLQELDTVNQRAIASIDIIYEQTNTTNASALKIKEATSLISSIAEETNLLSLNASIEAARAGEAGRGFAVVASQIQKLAEQSDSSARQIDDIIRALIDDSQKAVETMNQVKAIMQQQSANVSKTGTVFAQVRDGISQSLDGVDEIADKATRLDKARSGVVDVVQNLTAIAEENAASTQETSASVIEVSGIMNEISENAKQLKEIASILEDNMSSFKV
jgi:methyl-accepting chemotaxis protein